jgi:single-strand DNA-binding protein
VAILNQVLLIGRLTRDPLLRYTSKGTAWSSVGLAINRSYADADGEKKEETIFVQISFWDAAAQKIADFRKGQAVFIEGRLQFDVWDDKTTGQKRTQLKVVAENIQAV